MFYSLQGVGNRQINGSSTAFSAASLGQPETKWRGQRGGMPLGLGLGVPSGPLAFRYPPKNQNPSRPATSGGCKILQRS